MTKQNGYQFGTFAGVYLPSLLTILGVVMYMRLGHLVGELGFLGTMGILLVAESIAVATGLSISAISTNTPVQSGGPYFLISRSLGPGFGSSVGLTYFIAQTLSIPFYIIGFSEALCSAVPSLKPYLLLVGMGPLCLLFFLSLVGADWAIRVQYFISLVLGVSIMVVFAGALIAGPEAARFGLNFSLRSGLRLDLMTTAHFFAIFFPAVTGFLSGVNMSGDLADARRSIPRGTMLAIGSGFIIYLLEIVLFSFAYGREELSANCYDVLMRNAPLHCGFLVLAGVIAATLSSALGTLVGAPRILQAFAADRILTVLNPFAQGRGKKNDPVLAMAISFLISAVVIWWGARASAGGGEGGGNALNTVAELVTMFTLCTYAMINLSAAVESFAANPSFRPQFKYFHWSIGLFGTIASLLAAFLINPLLMLISLVVIVAIFLFTTHHSLQGTFADARRGFYFERVRRDLHHLASLPVSPKNWRPQMTLFARDLQKHRPLLEYGILLNNNRGIFSVVSIVSSQSEDTAQVRRRELQKMQDFSQETGLLFFSTAAVCREEDFDLSFSTLLQTHSLGPLTPNIILCGWPNDGERVEAYFRHVRMVHQMRLNCLLMMNEQRGLNICGGEEPEGSIDIWWRGRRNGSLMLVLAYLLTQNPAWRKIPIRLLRLSTEANHGEALRDLRHLSEEARIKTEQIVLDEQDFPTALRRESASASVIFLGFLPPAEEEAVQFYEEKSQFLKNMPVTFLIAGCGDADHSC